MDLKNRPTDKDTTKPRTLGLFGHSVLGKECFGIYMYINYI